MSFVDQSMDTIIVPKDFQSTGKPRLLRGVIQPFDGVELNCTVIEGVKPGRTILFTGGVHGAEVNSIEALRRLNNMPPEQLAGTVVIIHILNVQAFEKRVAFVMPEDGKNLNRQFPGHPEGTISEHLAYWLITKVYLYFDYYFDLHSGDATEDLDPFTIFVEDNPVSEALAMAFGLPRTLAVPAGASSTLNGAAAADLPGIIVEIGCGNRWSEVQVLKTLEGIARVMTYLSMLVPPKNTPKLSVTDAKEYNIRGRLVTPVEEAPAQPRIYKPRTYNAPCKGFWMPNMKLNEYIKSGQVLGRIENIWNETIETIEADVSGFNLYGSFALGVHEGEMLVCIASPVESGSDNIQLNDLTILPGETQIFTVGKGDYEVSTDRSRLDIDYILRFMNEKSHWGKGMTRDDIVRSIEGSISYGLYKESKQVGFARAITDCTTFAYYLDVFVDEDHRGLKLGTWLSKVVLDHPDLTTVKVWRLATADAHGVYKKSGWKDMENKDWMMEFINM